MQLDVFSWSDYGVSLRWSLEADLSAQPLWSSVFLESLAVFLHKAPSTYWANIAQGPIYILSIWGTT